MRYTIERVANGWLVMPTVRDDYGRLGKFSEFHVFNKIPDMLEFFRDQAALDERRGTL